MTSAVARTARFCIEIFSMLYAAVYSKQTSGYTRRGARKQQNAIASLQTGTH